LLAARILGASDDTIREKLERYAGDMSYEVIGKAERLEEVGFKAY
jgi:phosphoribosylcarboxyaminoimidazole (NCAIR) mutase